MTTAALTHFIQMGIMRAGGGGAVDRKSVSCRMEGHNR